VFQMSAGSVAATLRGSWRCEVRPFLN
jgi:hypothetical protein